MSLIYSNRVSGERVKLNNDQTCDEMLEWLRKLTVPGNTLITSLPSGIGLDFHTEADGLLWVEFYADTLSSAFVTMPVAEEIMRRSFSSGITNIKENYSDLISKWEY
jgi:hypothetical protein